jgi:recombination protein RecA
MIPLPAETIETLEYQPGEEALPDGLSSTLVFNRLIKATDLEQDRAHRCGNTGFGLNALRGRLVELSSCQPSACLSLSCLLILEAQSQMAQVVWIAATADTFFPPDLAANGVDLSSLPVVRVPDTRSASRAADWLLRTGAFGLLVVDLYTDCQMSAAQQARLAQLAHRHGSAVLFLTTKPAGAPSLGSLISLYGQIRRKRIDSGRFHFSLHIIKDKQRAPIWEHVEQLDGPPGLC